MGLNYNFNIRLNITKVEDVISLLKKEPLEFDKIIPNKEGISSNLLLTLPTDESIEEYYETVFSGKNLDSFKIEKNKRSVGYIYFFLTTKMESNELELCFMACTSAMSRLFTNSKSIQTYFKQLSENLNANYCYLDMEANGIKEILIHNEEDKP